METNGSCIELDTGLAINLNIISKRFKGTHDERSPTLNIKLYTRKPENKCSSTEISNDLHLWLDFIQKLFILFSCFFICCIFIIGLVFLRF